MCEGVPEIGVTVSLLFCVFTIPLLQSRYTPALTFILKLLKVLARIQANIANKDDQNWALKGPSTKPGLN